jgi:ribosomal-protein-serine acetyltransferase
LGAIERALLIDIPETLETGRLRLCAPQAGRGPAIHEAVVESYAQLKPWMPWAREVPAVEQSEKFCRESRIKWHARETIDFMIFRKADGLLVGGSGLHTIDWAVPRFEIGYWRRSSHGGRGLIVEAVQALSRMAFDRLGARRVEIRMDPRNARSVRVAERAGFTFEGVLRQDTFDPAGLPRDTRVFARVRGAEEP